MVRCDCETGLIAYSPFGKNRWYMYVTAASASWPTYRRLSGLNPTAVAMLEMTSHTPTNSHTEGSSRTPRRM